MINYILKINGGKFFDVYKFEEVRNPATGAKGKSYAYLTQVFAVIQPTGSRGTVKGFTLDNNANTGDVKFADCFMYSREERFEKERIKYRDKMYEIRSVEYYDNSYLRYHKSYLVKVDNQ